MQSIHAYRLIYHRNCRTGLIGILINYIQKPRPALSANGVPSHYGQMDYKGETGPQILSSGVSSHHQCGTLYKEPQAELLFQLGFFFKKNLPNTLNT